MENLCALQQRVQTRIATLGKSNRTSCDQPFQHQGHTQGAGSRRQAGACSLCSVMPLTVAEGEEAKRTFRVEVISVVQCRRDPCM